VGAETPTLRSLQRDHNLILLTSEEYAALSRDAELPLPLRHSDHFSRVLRRGDWSALVGDGHGNLVMARVNGGLIYPIGDSIQPESASQARRVILVQAWVKQKALALILQKAAEIGVAEIQLVDTEFSQPHSEKAARMAAILENACMQAFNPLKPKVVFAGQLSALSFPKETAFFGDLGAPLPLSAINLRHGASALFINGPEGGFSAAETALLAERATGVLLSENVLRSDSAAIIALGYLRLI
jgi:16S rRNA (uracil1498-N3)-methyltransferase